MRDFLLFLIEGKIVMNPRAFTAAGSLSALMLGSTVLAGPVHNLQFGVDVEKKTFTRQFTGTFRFDVGALDGAGKEVLSGSSGLEGVSFRFYGRTYTLNMLTGARAVFIDGELLGLAFKFRNPKGKVFRVAFNRLEALPTRNRLGGASFDDFVLVGSSNQTLNVAAPAGEPVNVISAPTPVAASSGLALLASMMFARRRRRW